MKNHREADILVLKVLQIKQRKEVAAYVIGLFIVPKLRNVFLTEQHLCQMTHEELCCGIS